MLGIGDKLPEFDLLAVGPESVKATSPDQAFIKVSDKDYKGKWKVLFFWPKDFTFVCPTEIIAFGDINDEFADRDTQLIGGSIDNEFVHLAWQNDHEGLHGSPFPWVSDIKRELSNGLGKLDKNEGVSLRATFIVDPDNIIRHVSVNDLSVGRNPEEVLRILDALQTDELCPCNWKQGEDTL